MTHATRKTKPARRRLSASLDHLEDRALMTASAVTHYAFVPIHAEVAQSTTHVVAKPAQHAATTTHAPVQHSAAKVVKPTHASTTHQAKATAKVTRATPNKLTALVVTPHIVNAKKVAGKITSAGGGTPVPGALTPIQVNGAYGVTALGVANQGQGQTIGIIDEYHDPSIVADTNVFSTQYGLPNFNVAGGPTLTVTKDTTFGSVPNSPIGGAGTSVETSLDVEWAHAMAPRANILLIEVPADNDLPTAFKELLQGIQFAASQGASVVSLSYGYIETNYGYPFGGFIDLPNLYSLDQTYLSTGAASKVAVAAASQDFSIPAFPASSPNVIGVGGTALHVTGTNGYSFETAWGGNNTSGAGGGGTTAFYTFPTFQSANGVTNYNGHRNLPDISLIADPVTGVSVYDSYDTTTNGGNPWTEIGGTSLATPVFAGELAIVQQQRAAASKAPLTSVQINNAMYALYNSPNYSTYFHDITQGNNSDTQFGFAGHSTTTGYDLATGIGSPIANKLIPYLASL